MLRKLRNCEKQSDQSNSGHPVDPVPGGGVIFAAPVLLDSSHPQLAWVEDRLEKYQEKLQEYREVVMVVMTETMVT